VLETGRIRHVVWYVRPGKKLPLTFTRPAKTPDCSIGFCRYQEGSGVFTQLKGRRHCRREPGQVHGAMNTGLTEPFIFVSVVAPSMPLCTAENSGQQAGGAGKQKFQAFHSTGPPSLHRCL